MNKKMLILASFLSSALLVTNTLQVVSCKRKPSKVDDKNENEKTAEQVELETATKLKVEIRNAIDEIVTNPSGENWIINLIEQFDDNYQIIINTFNKTIENTKNEGKNKVAFSEILNLDVTLVETVKSKFVGLREKIMERIEQKATQLGVVDFNFEFALDSILPALTTLTGSEVINAVNRLKGLKDPSITTYSAILDASVKVEDIDQIDLYKVITDLQYSFSFGNKQYTDSYNNCELFLTKDIDNYKELDHFIQKTIANTISKDTNITNINIYSGNKTEFEKMQKFEYIGKQMDWDFSKQEVKDEIKQMQHDNIKDSKKLKNVVNDLQLNMENIEFEPLNYMEFSNNGFLIYPINDLSVFVSGKVSGEGEGKKADYFRLSETEIKKRMYKRYGLDENGTLKTSWDVDAINNRFIAKLKQDGEGGKPIIDYSKYYGVGKNAKDDSDFLLGYGRTTIKKAYYADIPLAKIDIISYLVVPYNPDFDNLFNDFVNYVTTLIDAAWNGKAENDKKDNGISVYGTYDGWKYFLQWNFGYLDEWKAIQDEVKEKGKISFNWIMEEILLKKRVLSKNSNYKLTNDIKDFIAKTSIHTEQNVVYERCESNKCKNEKMNDHLVNLDPKSSEFQTFIKYGPFKFYLSNRYTYTNWNSHPGRENSRLPSITNWWTSALTDTTF